ncbi:MAG: N-6 DNA methylase [Candidatus Parabeggiatoa sp. nov. 1]|nr:MAG: N-6 DNA methylase [Gammaproteobacteria bacterium]
MPRKTKQDDNGKRLTTQQSVNQAVKNICDIMRRSNCAGAMQYVPELSWILFLRILDEQETKEAEEYEAVGQIFTFSLESPYRWHDWAAPPDEEYCRQHRFDHNVQGWQRFKLTGQGELNQFKTWINGKLLPHLKKLKKQKNATTRQKVISEVMSSVERVRIDTDRNLLEILDKVHELSLDTVDETHIFPLSQVYEGLLLKMGEKGNDGGQFFTPREIIRVMVQVLDPKIGETVYDPACGTGGFLAQAFEYMAGKDEQGNLYTNIKSPKDIEVLKQWTFYGREKDDIVYPIALANLVLHRIDAPHLWHGNTLTDEAIYTGLFENAPAVYDVILTNPPFGGKESREVKKRFGTGATQVLFLKHALNHLNENAGQCGIVLDEGLLFRTNEKEFVNTKRLLLNECEVWCIVSLPGGVFTAAGAGVKTNLVFFTKGQPTDKIWYYDLSHLKIGKRNPLTVEQFADFLKRLPLRQDSDYSWTIDFTERKRQVKAQAEPFKKEAEAKKKSADKKREQLKKLKAAKTRNSKKIETLTIDLKQLDKEVRELNTKAQDIENAIYDLKAVNPNAKDETDTRTPAELLDFLEEKGKEVAEILARLK